MQHHSFYIAEQFTRGRLPHQEEQIWGCLWLRRQPTYFCEVTADLLVGVAFGFGGCR